MKMNVYDFDGTIYDGDSSVDFILYCLRYNPKLTLHLLPAIPRGIDFFLKKISLTQYKEILFRIWKVLGKEKVLELREAFWKSHHQKIKKWYFETQKESDVVISASPYFLLEPICHQLGIRHLIASPFDLETGTCNGPNCRDHQKVIRFYEEFPDGEVDCFYSDSDADLPLARIARQAIKVKKNKLIDWIQP